MSENKACVNADKEKESMNTCTWAVDADGNWRTGCNEIHIIIDGTPSENGYVYCPYCGSKIETVIYNAPREGRAFARTIDAVVRHSESGGVA